MRKIAWIILFILLFGSWIWGIYQWQEVKERIDDLGSRIKGIKTAGVGSYSEDDSENAYRITVDMWQIFEKELQDYQQRLREGKRQYSEQQSGWNQILTELKKTLQEYDKFVAAEGEFWEKQLRNYEKLLAKSEDRFDALGQIIEDLSALIVDFQQWWETQDEALRSQIKEESVGEAGEVQQKKVGTVIKSRIQGRGGYKTYPSRGDEEVETKIEEESGDLIRGTVSGSGSYKTY